MALFDNLDSIKDRAMDLAQSGVAKSRQIAEIAKLKTANMSEEDAMKKAYIEIGKLYYAERGMAPEAAYEALCRKITAAKVNIEENKSRIEELRAENGVVDVEPVSAEEIYVAPPSPAEPAAEDNGPQE